MFLIYINEIGKDFKNQKQYEFIFGKNTDVEMDEWTIIPSSGRGVPPDIEYIDLVGLLKNSYLELELIQNSDYFGVIDAVDGIIALGWEPYDPDAEEEEERLSFHFGEELSSVANKLTSKGLRLINDEITYKFQ